MPLFTLHYVFQYKYFQTVFLKSAVIHVIIIKVPAILSMAGYISNT